MTDGMAVVSLSCLSNERGTLRSRSSREVMSAVVCPLQGSSYMSGIEDRAGGELAITEHAVSRL